jgi:hypothetical protein
MDLEGTPDDLERDAPGKLRAGFLEADRPDEAPRSGVVAEDLDAHDLGTAAHCPFPSRSLKTSATLVSTSLRIVSRCLIIRFPDVHGELVAGRREVVEPRQNRGAPGRAVVR